MRGLKKKRLFLVFLGILLFIPTGHFQTTGHEIKSEVYEGKSFKHSHYTAEDGTDVVNITDNREYKKEEQTVEILKRICKDTTRYKDCGKQKIEFAEKVVALKETYCESIGNIDTCIKRIISVLENCGTENKTCISYSIENIISAELRKDLLIGEYKLLVPLRGGETTLGGKDRNISADVVSYLFEDVFNLIILVASILAIIFLASTGFLMILSQMKGDVFGYKEAKDKFYRIVLGIIVLLCSYIILQQVNPQLTEGGKFFQERPEDGKGNNQGDREDEFP